MNIPFASPIYFLLTGGLVDLWGGHVEFIPSWFVYSLSPLGFINTRY